MKIQHLICAKAIIAYINGQNTVVYHVGTIIPVIAGKRMYSEFIDNFVKLDGQTLKIADYPELFEVIGHSVSTEKGSLTFCQRIGNLFGAKNKAPEIPLCNLAEEFVLPNTRK